MKNVYSPVKLGLNQCPTWVHNDRCYILLGQFSIIEYMLSNCSLFDGLYISYPYITASLSIYHTIWPDLLTGRYFGGLLKLWHLTGLTLAIEQVLAIMLFIGKWLIKCAGNFTGLWASFGLLGHNWWWNATENYTFRSRMTQQWASTILIERPKPGLHLILLEWAHFFKSLCTSNSETFLSETFQSKCFTFYHILLWSVIFCFFNVSDYNTVITLPTRHYHTC